MKRHALHATSVSSQLPTNPLHTAACPTHLFIRALSRQPSPPPLPPSRQPQPVQTHPPSPPILVFRQPHNTPPRPSPPTTFHSLTALPRPCAAPRFPHTPRHLPSIVHRCPASPASATLTPTHCPPNYTPQYPNPPIPPQPPRVSHPLTPRPRPALPTSPYPTTPPPSLLVIKTPCTNKLPSPNPYPPLQHPPVHIDKPHLSTRLSHPPPPPPPAPTSHLPPLHTHTRTRKHHHRPLPHRLTACGANHLLHYPSCQLLLHQCRLMRFAMRRGDVVLFHAG